MGKNLAICIGRQYGSGGHEVGKKLAEALNLPFYDKEILKKAAAKSGIVEEMFERADEKPTDSFLYSLSMGQGVQSISLLMNNEYLSNDNLFVIQANTIKELAAEHDCVMIGRCADYILEDVCNVVSVFIHADKEDRIKRISKKESLKESDAATKVRKADKKRANYYNFYAENAWGVASTYDLCLNSSKLGIDGCVEMIQAFLEHRTK